MAHGVIHGVTHGVQHGVNRGAPAIAWTVDATSGIATPQDATEWDAFISNAGITAVAPNSIWLCNEASGNLLDVVGADNLTAQGASHLYNQTVTGWTRKAVGTTNVATQRWEDNSFANTATTSVMLLAFVQNLSTPAAAAGIVGMGTSTTQYGAVFLSGTTTVRARSTNLADGAANAFGTTNVRPVIIQVDVTGSRTRYYSDTEKLSPTYAACAGSLLTLGAVGGGNSISGRYLYACAWKGAGAELSNANVKALLEAMGWTVGWSP